MGDVSNTGSRGVSGMTSDMHFTPAMFRVQKDDVITSKKGFLFHSEMTGMFYRVTKLRVVGFDGNGSVTVERIKSEEVEAFPVEQTQEAGND